MILYPEEDFPQVGWPNFSWYEPNLDVTWKFWYIFDGTNQL